MSTTCIFCISKVKGKHKKYSNNWGKMPYIIWFPSQHGCLPSSWLRWTWGTCCCFFILSFIPCFWIILKTYILQIYVYTKQLNTICQNNWHNIHTYFSLSMLLLTLWVPSVNTSMCCSATCSHALSCIKVYNYYANTYFLYL